MFLMTVFIFTTLPLGLHAQLRNNEVFFSVPSSNNQIQILYQSSTQPLMMYPEESGTTMIPMDQYNDYEGWWHCFTGMPAYSYLGFAGDTAVPLFWNDTVQPPMYRYTPITTDPSGDNLFDLNNLDIVRSLMTYSADKLYFAIQNSGGGFPTSSGFTFYSYMPIIANPEADPDTDPIVFGLLYTTNVTGIISPGLYKISGTGFADLQYLAPIETSIDAVTNKLYLSCNISDLMNDADFMSWYDVDNPRIATMTITSKITLTGGTQESDRTDSNDILLTPIQIINPDDFEPTLELQSFDYIQDTVNLTVTYHDADGTIPLAVDVQIDNDMPISLTPQLPLDFGSVVTYVANDIPVSSDWIMATVKCSDDGLNYQTIPILHNTANQDTYAPPANASYALYPNPAVHEIFIQPKNRAEKPTTLSIYNIKGQKLSSRLIRADEQFPLKFSLDQKFSAGLYMVKIETPKRTITKRFLKIVE